MQWPGARPVDAQRRGVPPADGREPKGNRLASLNVMGCDKLTTLPKELCDIPARFC